MTLLEIERQIKDIQKEIEDSKQQHESKMKILNAQKENALRKKETFLACGDIGRAENARRFIYTEGFKENYGLGDTKRTTDEAVDDIVSGMKIIKEQYFGCKNYACYICQGSDHSYGFGPKHGYIVFEIGAKPAVRKGDLVPTDKDREDIVYYLRMLQKSKENRAAMLLSGE